MNKYSTFLIIVCCIFSCQKNSALLDQKPVIAEYQIEKKIKIRDVDLKDWFLKDVVLDTIPGLSISRINQHMIDNQFRRKSEVVVAVIDSDIDINHEYLKDFIWFNDAEIANNGIDDDNNGYIDDRNGWNFICSKGQGNSVYFNYEFVRILKKHAKLKASYSKEEFKRLERDTNYIKTYSRAKKVYDDRLKVAIEEKFNAISMDENNRNAKKWLSTLFKNNEYDAQDVDSLKSIYVDNKEYSLLLTVKSNFLTYNFTDEVIAKNLESSTERVDKLLNLEFNDRLYIGDDENNLLDSNYGCGNLTLNAKLLNHGTTVAGAIVAVLAPIVQKSKGKATFKIMPLALSAIGDENDKDIALAIRYAVDNGANIINMSSSKSFSVHEDWVQEAIAYADNKNVLIITSAGNDGENLDEIGVYNYPNDLNFENKEIASNFIKVGASGYELNNSLKRKSSNFGSRDVDVFAPGTHIYTSSTSNEKYEYSSGTSLAAPLTSGVAALVKLANPSYSSSKIKEILLNSGVRYDVPILLKKNDTLTKSFSSLSKTGRIINAYNALIYTEKN